MKKKYTYITYPVLSSGATWNIWVR